MKKTVECEVRYKQLSLGALVSSPNNGRAVAYREDFLMGYRSNLIPDSLTSEQRDDDVVTG